MNKLICSHSDRVFAGLSFILMLCILALTTWLAVLMCNQKSRHSHAATSELAAGTDMFWELHDRHFPEHYLQDGRVICTEARAAKELETIGLTVER